MRRILAAVRRILREPEREAGVHFHSGPYGLPSPCYEEGCRNPRLSMDAR
jgi:hypothetical protein